jgi:hypothetical protein
VATNYWITTHWPVPEGETSFGRHVYVKARHRTVPQAGDVVFVRESVRVRGKLSPTVDRCHLGRRRPTPLPAGYGGVIGRTVVMGGARRPIAPSDVVFDYGDLPDWRIIECDGFERLRLPLSALMAAIGKPGSTSTRFLDLYRVPDALVPKLLAACDRSGSVSTGRADGKPRRGGS